MTRADRWGLRIVVLVLCACAAVLMLSFAVKPATRSDLERRVGRLEEQLRNERAHDLEERVVHLEGALAGSKADALEEFRKLVMGFALQGYAEARESSQTNACINNLRQIDAAKEQWALANRKVTGEPITEKEVNAYIKGGGPKCPAGGVYIYNRIGADPECSIPGHELP